MQKLTIGPSSIAMTAVHRDVHFQVLAPGGQIDGPGVHFFTVVCFPHRKFGDARKLLRDTAVNVGGMCCVIRTGAR